ncbi:DinB family protein [Actinacidiphila acidipaludis]|uniref:DinB family protein n=1 Tax=Actinacidiphila acidipaludis TaxID=2873382 RepID=A0ABS7Q3Z7_9ACTN|nr:DinB family protein [Streptomyces acidipaludis]MBY8877865.1 DinB family protein [Streptomyces acidipaludis]
MSPETGEAASGAPVSPPRGRGGDLRPPESRADEKATLLTFLDYLRESVIRKTEGVPDEVAGTPAVPSGTSLFWLLRHLTAVELNWFLWAYDGQDVPLWDDDPAPDAGGTRDELVAAYREAVRRADAVVAACDDLDRPGARSLRETAPPTMRWVLVHMIEETGRHAGHADILRELYDGSVGR